MGWRGGSRGHGRGVVGWWMVVVVDGGWVRGGGLVGAGSWVMIVQFTSFEFEFKFNHSLIVKFYQKFDSAKIYY